MPPVPDVGDVPLRRLLEIDHEVDASAVGVVDIATAEDHLTTPVPGACLAGCETERRQHRIEDSGHPVERRIVGWDGIRAE